MFLVVLSGTQQGKVLKLERDGVFGREPTVDYPVEDPTVSRRHAQVLRVPDGWLLRDLGSANGTEINGARLVGDRVLREGDVLSLGRVTLSFSAQLAGTVRAAGPVAVERTVQPLPMETVDAQLGQRMLSALKSEHKDADSQAEAALRAIVSAVPGAVRACLVDWKLGRILARSPTGAEISRSTVFRALAALRSNANGVAIWQREDCAALAQQLSVAEVDPFVALTVDSHVGLLVEGAPADSTGAYAQVGADMFRDAVLLLKIPLAALRAQAAAGSRKMRDSDLRLAQRIQQRLLSPPPAHIDGFELALSYTPAMMVGGDFFHVEQRAADELAVVIGDVSGKGVSGAMYMAYLVADLRHHLRTCVGPASLLETMHASLVPVLEPGMFVTVAAAYLNTRTGICRVGLAGHSAPVLRTAARKVMEMGLDPGSPIGAQNELTVREQRLQLAPGDCLVLTTDGVEEGENSAGEPYGKARRDQVLLSCDTAAEINETLRKSLLEFVGRDRSSDDLTIICLGRGRA